MMAIADGSYLDYLFLFGESRTAYSDYSVRNALNSGGNLYIMMEDENAAGYLCTAKEDKKVVVSYAYTVPEKRNAGIFTSLMKHVTVRSEYPVKLSISEKSGVFSAVQKVCFKLGFVEQSSCIVFSGDEKGLHNWNRYMEKTGQKICDALLRQGLESISFSEADRNLIEELYYSESNSFKNKLTIQPFFDNVQKGLDRDMSFMAVRDGEIAAYTLVSRPDQTNVVFEHISTAEKYIGSGVILLPFSKSMETFARFHCKRAAYAMYESNTFANAFRKKLLEKVTSSQIRSYNFIYEKKENYNE